MLKIGRIISAMLASTVVFAAAPATAVAQSSAATQSGAAAQESERVLTFGEIAAKVEAQGYREIEEIEREGKDYEVCAKDRAGREVELSVNGKTGKVEKVEISDD